MMRTTRTAALVSAALAFASGAQAAGQPAAADLQRAKTKKPRDEYRGEDQGELS
eukprot:CAMPEP_0115131924 /NCGR_PEP_ID=MMETSP0227-20121206/53424_1 /TAXON_ID=89957 /ORGANISM="Polarella glacialis, Strain CCMP 1383" /LENGTH=53 /DNA_ID=CAMNT_0002537573 /DNA_START=14 /DNA_END=172 /DNA_ORIENTATION=+